MSASVRTSLRTVVPGIRWSLFLVLVTLLAFSNLSNAQMSASLLGTVVDVQGNPLSGVTLKLLYQGNVTREIEAVSYTHLTLPTNREV